MQSPSQSLYLPDTLEHWPWPRTLNPFYDDVKEESRTWIHSFYPFTSRSQYAFDRGNFALLASLSYPTASRATLLAGCNLFNLLFAIDEYTDVQPVSVARQVADIVMDAIKNPDQPRPDGELVLGEIAKRFWMAFVSDVHETAQRHLLQKMSNYLVAVVQQAIDNDAGRYHTVEEYMEKRRDNAGMWVAFVILELDLTSGLPDEVSLHPTVVELCTYAVDIITIDNDILSYNKEQATGDDRYNLLTVIMHQHRTDYDGAISLCMTMHDELKAKFLDCFKRIPSFGAELDEQVKRYLNGVASWPRANVSWSFEGGRYFGTRGLEYQITRRVPLLPKVDNFRDRASGDAVVVPLVEEL